MELYKTIPWEHEGKKYETRIVFETNVISVLAFLDKHPVNGFRYQILLPGNSDVRRVLKENDLTCLVETVRQDVIEKRWEQLLI